MRPAYSLTDKRQTSDFDIVGSKASGKVGDAQTMMNDLEEITFDISTTLSWKAEEDGYVSTRQYV